MKEYRNLAEWLESEGNPKHHIAEGEDGSMVIAVESKDKSQGITLYSYREYHYENGHSYLHLGSGWCIRKEYLPAIKGYLNKEETENINADDCIQFDVLKWTCEGEDEFPAIIDTLYAVSEYHAKALLRDRIKYNKYPKGTWLEYKLDGKRIELDTAGRFCVTADKRVSA